MPTKRNFPSISCATTLTAVFLAAFLSSQILPPAVHATAGNREAKTNRDLHAAEEDAPEVQSRDAYNDLPLSFEVNQGQTSPQVKFLSRGSGFMLFLTPHGAKLLPVAKREDSQEKEAVRGAYASKPPDTGVASAAVDMTLSGANLAPQILGLEELPGKSNYFIGSDPAKWRTGVPNYARVMYGNVYPGIDLFYHGDHRQLEYDFVVAPGADPRAIAVNFERADGIEVDAAGDLLLHTSVGLVRQRKPFAYQQAGGEQKPVACDYVLTDKRQVRFRLGNYDTNLPLTIDPSLSYSTYLGGSSGDEGNGITVDSGGNAYAVGSTASVNFPTMNPKQRTLAGNNDVFVAKLSAAGNALVYSTYLGGDGDDQGKSIAIDSSGNAYITGSTASPHFPTTANVFQGTNGGTAVITKDCFVTKLDALGGMLVYSTYLGGSGNDIGNGIAVDSAGNAYVTGETISSNFPVAHALQANYNDARDAFVTKLNQTGSAPLLASTYLGGSGSDSGNAIAVDHNNNAYVTGKTGSTNFPGSSRIGSVGSDDAFITKLNMASTPNVTAVYFTYLGGSGADAGNSIVVDSAGSAYVTGSTGSLNFPTLKCLQCLSSGDDAFVTKLNAAGSAPPLFSTYLGGSNKDEGRGIAIDAVGNVYVTGRTSSTNFKTADAIQANNAGGVDVFVTKLSVADNILAYAYSTYIGGSGTDRGNGIAVDSGGNAYVAGSTTSTNFPISPTVNPLQATYGGAGSAVNSPGDAFVFKVGPTVPPPGFSLAPGSQTLTPGSQGTLTLTITPAQSSGISVSLASTNPSAVTVQSPLTVPAGSTSQTFQVMTVGAGTADITASFGGSTATAAVNVASTGVIISLSPSPLNLQPNTQGQMTVTINPAQTANVTISLSSSNTAIAALPSSVTIPANGSSSTFTVTAGATTGPAVITATLPVALGGGRATATVNVGSTSTFALSPATQQVLPVSTFRLTLLVNPPPPVDTNVTLTSSNTSVATVPATVKVLAGKTTAPIIGGTRVVGSATITATLGGKSATAVVNVANVVTPTLTFIPNYLSLSGGGRGTLTVRINPAPSADQGVFFTSSTPALAVTSGVLIPAGKTTVCIDVSGTDFGTAKVTASLPSGIGGATATATVESAVPLGSPTISLSPPSQSIGVGTTGTVTVTISQAQSTNTTVTLASCDPGVVTVPISVIIPAGSKTSAFTVTGRSSSPSFQMITATLSRSAGGGMAKATVHVQ